GMSGSHRSSNQTRLGKEKFEALIRAAFEQGIRFFDCADLYGSHAFIIPALKGIPRNDYIISTKIWFRRGGIPESERPDADVVIKRFLKELNTDYIDNVQLHCTTSEDWPANLKKQMDIMDRLKEKGVIRAHGVSCHSLDALKTAASNPWVDMIHARINAFGNHMDASPQEVVEVLQKAHKAGKGVIGMKLVGQGDFRYSSEKRRESIEFVLNSGVVDTMIVGFEKAGEIDDFANMVNNTVKRAS
ncbi:aldo/keto reductase, partial [candidate division KSB1 bacterium]|nr:aldo/keto reductase [candidate division KSB1 bacterium]